MTAFRASYRLFRRRARRPAASTAPRWQAPLDRLRLGAGTRFVAGLADEDQLFVLELIERSPGTRVDISHACGLGRLAELPQAAADRYVRV